MAKKYLKCTLCETEDVELYHCETCSVSEVETESSSHKQLLCEPCLGSHVRQGHQVTTSKGQELLICTQHRRLHNHYCKSCDESFCSTCLGNHSGHFIESIDERASKVRKEVFSMLTALENNEKTLRARNEKICKLKLPHQTDQNNLKEFVEKHIEILRQKLLSRIDENKERMEREEKAVTQVIDQVLDFQSKSRMLLSSTSPHLVNKFKDVKLSFEKVYMSFEQTMLNKICIKPPDLQFLEDIIDEAGQTIEDKLRSDFQTEKLEVVQHVLLNGKRGSKFCLIIEKGEAIILTVKVAEGREPMLEKMSKMHLNFIGPVKACYSVYSNSHKCSCVIITYTSIAFRIDVTENDNLELNEILFPPFANLISAYTIPENSGEIYWCYWSAEQKVLKLSHEPLFEEKCPSEPSFVSLDIDGHGLCFIEDEKIFIVDPRQTKVESISPISWKSESHVILYRGSSMYILSKRSIWHQCYEKLGNRNQWRTGILFESRDQGNSIVVRIRSGGTLWFFPSLKLQYDQNYYQFNHVALFPDL